VPEGLAHTGEGVLVPVGRHRLGEVSRALDTRLSRRADNSLSEPRDPVAGARLRNGFQGRCCHDHLLGSRPWTAACLHPSIAATHSRFRFSYLRVRA
jgi:hypothetical protein